MKKKQDKEEYSFEGHVWFLDKHAGKQVCAQCGLVFLRNPASIWCIEKGCNYTLHGSYERTMSNLTRMDW